MDFCEDFKEKHDFGVQWRTQKIPEGGKFRHNRVTSQINFRTTIL